MKINKNALISFFSLMVFPLLGFFIAILSLKFKKNNNSFYILISIFFAIIFIKVPPMYDLNIRYWEIVSIENNFYQIFYEFQDFILYLFSYCVLNLNFPFYVIPAFFVGLMVYAYLKSIDIFLHINDYNISNKKFIIIIFSGILFFNFLVYGLGLRFGMGMFFFIYGVILNINKKYYSSIFWIFLSIFSHFSMFLPLLAFITSKFITIGKKRAIILTIVVSTIASIVGLYFIKDLNILGVGEHSEVYIDGEWSKSSENIGYKIPTLILRTIAFSFIFMMLLSRKKIEKFDNFILIFIVFLSFTISSYTAYSRYLTIVMYFLYIRQIYCYFTFDTSRYLKNYRKILSIVIVISVSYMLIVANLLINRRIILVGEMWQGFYTPPAILLYQHTQNDFEKYFYELDGKGYSLKYPQKQ